MSDKIKAKPRKTALGTITPGFNDTLNGQKITMSSFPMGMHAGKATMTHNGKSHEITIIQNIGASISLSGPKRHFNLDLQKLVEHAIENGLLDDVIDFTEAAD